VTLHVQPNARKNAIGGLYGDALKLKIAAPATDDKANTALIDLLSSVLDVPRSSVSIRHGTSSRRKVIEVSGGPVLVARLNDLLSRPGRGVL